MKLIFFLGLGVAMVAGDAEAATAELLRSGRHFASLVTPVMESAKTAIPGNEGWPVDNLIRAAKPQLSPSGFGFALADGSFANPFFGEHFDPTGFLAVVSDPARHVRREPRINFEAVRSSGP